MQSLRSLGILSLFLCVIFRFAVVSAEAATLDITATDVRTNSRLSGVSIAITPETGDVTTGVSNTNGVFVVADLAAGTYTITASLAGYADAVIADITLAADETKSIEISLSSNVIQLERVSVTASRRREKVLEAPRVRCPCWKFRNKGSGRAERYGALKISACGGCGDCWNRDIVCCRPRFQQRFFGVAPVTCG